MTDTLREALILVAIGAGFSVIGWIFKLGIDNLLKKIDKITETLEIHNEKFISQNEKLITILSRNEIISEWVDNHENRLDEQEKKIDKIETSINDIRVSCAANNHKKLRS